MNEAAGLLKQTFDAWRADKAPRLAAALAYYTLFSLVPLLLIAIGVGRLFLSEAHVRSALIDRLVWVFGAAREDFFRSLIDGALLAESGVAMTVVGVAVLLFGAANVFGQLQDALNTVWKARVDIRPGFGHMIRRQLTAFLMVLAMGLVLTLSVGFSAGLSVLTRFFADRFDWLDHVGLWQLAEYGVSFCILTVLFALVFRYLSATRMAWVPVLWGAWLTAVLFVFAKWLISLYLGYSDIGSVFGAAGSVAVLMLWLYFAGQIFLFGAEFVQVMANRRGGNRNA
jgi:membrane protein